ncbi:NAD(P)-binding protein [Testicularia cyperi]|uniref:NAD(P)-binding protein n=1 Tax=Testicularia cyperi TaxID=1882483 RepID=A0A317XGS2_9BASI|nr:NAD(P)-binding protein [Testicularia cyperi]
MSALTISSLTDRLNGYYTRLTATRGGTAALVAFALWATRLVFRSRKRAAAKKAWSNLTAEVAVVTGGSGGIGIEVVRRLAAKGVKVAILDIVEPNKSVLSPTVKFYRTDLTDYDNIVEVAKQIERELGPVTILVNNAGVANDGPSVMEFDPKKTKLTIEVNLLSHFYTLRVFLPHMVRANHGHVMATASAGSFIMPAGGADYGATKAGVLSLHETLQVELDLLYGRRDPGSRTGAGIALSICHPFWVASPMTSQIFKPEAVSKFLEPSWIADKMVDRLLSGCGGSLYLPGWIGNLAWLRVLPHALQHRIRCKATMDLHKAKREDRPDAIMP